MPAASSRSSRSRPSRCPTSQQAVLSGCAAQPAPITTIAWPNAMLTAGMSPAWWQIRLEKAACDACTWAGRGRGGCGDCCHPGPHAVRDPTLQGWPHQHRHLRHPCLAGKSAGIVFFTCCQMRTAGVLRCSAGVRAACCCLQRKGLPHAYRTPASLTGILLSFITSCVRAGTLLLWRQRAAAVRERHPAAEGAHSPAGRRHHRLPG